MIHTNIHLISWFRLFQAQNSLTVQTGGLKQHYFIHSIFHDKTPDIMDFLAKMWTVYTCFGPMKNRMYQYDSPWFWNNSLVTIVTCSVYSAYTWNPLLYPCYNIFTVYLYKFPAILCHTTVNKLYFLADLWSPTGSCFEILVLPSHPWYIGGVSVCIWALSQELLW